MQGGVRVGDKRLPAATAHARLVTSLHRPASQPTCTLSALPAGSTSAYTVRMPSCMVLLEVREGRCYWRLGKGGDHPPRTGCGGSRQKKRTRQG